jgi:signal transduction histidine kinase
MTTEPGANRHRPRPRRWPHLRDLPGGMAGRVVLIIFVAMLAIETVQHLFGVQDDIEDTELAIEQGIARQVVNIIELWEKTPRSQYDELTKAFNGVALRATFLESAPEIPPPPDWLEDEIERASQKYFGESSERVVKFGMINTRQHKELAYLAAADFAQSWPVRYLTVSAELKTGGVLVVALPGIPDVWDYDDGTSFWRIFFWIAVIALIFWISHRMTRPIRRFATAADRLGVDVNAPPLPVQGSRELRRATRAFNRMQERLQRFIGDRTQMLAAISHDLRTSLTRLRLRTEFIEDEEQKAKAVADLDEMDQMLTATLSFARDENADGDNTRFDLSQLVQSLVDDFSDMGRTARFSGPPHYIFAGRHVAISRAVTNLMSNAVTYGGEVDVEIHGTSGGVEIIVMDRGPGIPKEKRDEVFNPFFRLEPSRNRETGGVGLGLSVARSIVRAHGGDISFEDRESGGLVVRIDLPTLHQPTDKN